MRTAAILIVGIAALASSAPALADEAALLRLVHEQVLETGEFDGETAPLFLPCGNAGFLYARREEDIESNWYLYRTAAGTSTDTGLPYGDEIPDACSADGNWATVVRLGSTDSRIVSLRPETDASLAITNGSVFWSDDADAKAFVWFYVSEGKSTEFAFTGNLDGVELFAGQLEPGTLTGLPAWAADGRIILGWPKSGDNAVLILPVEQFRFDENVSIDSMPILKDVVETPEASLLFLMKGAASNLLTFQTDKKVVLIHEYAFPPYAARYLCMDEGGWQCDSVPIRPTVGTGGHTLEILWLLDSTGRLFWIENRGGEFCAAMGAARSNYGNCEHDGPLSMFEEIWWNAVSPDARHVFVVGRKPYDDEIVLAVFELAVEPVE